MKIKNLDSLFANLARFTPLLIIVGLGVALTFYSFWLVRGSEMERLQNQFADDAGDEVSTIENKLEEHLADMAVLHSFFGSSEVGHQELDEFTSLTDPLLYIRPGVRAFGWVARVNSAERDSCETELLDRYAFSAGIQERDGKGKAIPAAERNGYYPVTYLEPIQENKSLLGYDFGTDARCREAMERARDTRALAASAGIRLQGQGDHFGFVVVDPVYRKDMPVASVVERRAALAGFALVVFRFEDIIQGAIPANVPHNLVISLMDITDPQRTQFIVRSGPPESVGISTADAELTKLVSASQHDFKVAGRLWRFTVTPTPAYIKAHRVQSYWLILPAGGLLTLFVFLMVNSLLREIAKKKRIASALVLSKKELLLKNSELAAAIDTIRNTQARLIRQEKLAGIGQLAAEVAHEINNPLGFVTSNFEMLQEYFSTSLQLLTQYRELRAYFDGTDNVSCKEALKRLAEQESDKELNYIINDLPDLFRDTDEGLARINKIVKGLRLFSRIDQIQEYLPYDLNVGIETTLGVANNEIKYRAAVETKLGQIPPIEAISSEINQVLLNLIVNAAQAIEGNSEGAMGLIRITTWHDEQFVCCSIEDNGAGISAENMSKIFDPFFTTKPIGFGTGLGLSISYDIIVNRHSGELTVESTHGGGTKFILRLPLQQAIVSPEPGDQV